MKPRSLALLIEDASGECFMSPWDNASNIHVSYQKYAQGVINVWNTLTDIEQKWTDAGGNKVHTMGEIIDSNGAQMHNIVDMFSSYAGYILLRNIGKCVGSVEVAVRHRYRNSGHATRMLSALTHKFLNGDYPDISVLVFFVRDDDKVSQAFIKKFSRNMYEYREVRPDYFGGLLDGYKAYVLDR